MIKIKNYGSANIVKGESRARRKSKILFKAMPSRILYYVNIMQMGTINIGFAPMYIVKCKLSYIKKKQKIKPP